MSGSTPMMEQYTAIKSRHRDEILFFRLGDFYEMFDADAKEASALLNLTLTRRGGRPMCGVPYHAAANYVARLLKLGRKVAICEQVAQAGGKGLFERKVTEVVSPGTVVDEGYLDKGRNSYLAAVGGGNAELSFCYMDLSTGEFMARSLPRARAADELRKELGRVQPAELLVQQSLLEEAGIAAAIMEREGLLVNKYPDWCFDAKESARNLAATLGAASLKGFGIEGQSPEIAAAGVILEYLRAGERGELPHVRGLRVYRDADYLGLDEATQRGLELVANSMDGSRKYSLLEVLDHTRTAMGARKLRSWIMRPLRDAGAIEARLDAVEALWRDQRSLSALREALAPVLDLERLASRIALGKAHPKDLAAVRSTIEACLAAEALLAEGARWKGEGREALTALAAELGRALKDDPSVLLADGDVIREGYDEALDGLRALRADSKSVLERYVEGEREASGIPSLRIKYNKIIGYFLEVSKSKGSAVPAHFVRRQSLVGGERYSTDRLVELETSINGAEEGMAAREKELFLALRERAKALIAPMQSLADHIAAVDCHASLAYAATVRAYVRPRLAGGTELVIEGGRHPVVEAYIPSGEFVPNALALGPGGASFALITGPNMAGKSTFLRQTALIVVMAQMGSFVPAASATVGVADRVFCRVGAQDNLARGESTFLVEMNETARILNSATERSLVIMDEVGRGTSTTDGLCIARAVAEHIMGAIGCRCLFATHYRELTQLSHPALENLSLEVSEEGGKIRFLKRVVRGPAAGSYGIHVATLAGIPGEVVARAEELQATMESESSIERMPSTGNVPTGAPAAEKKPSAPQASLFSEEELIISEIKSIDAERLTPLEALTRIAIWKKGLGA